MVRHSQGRVLAQEKKTAEESVYRAVSGEGDGGKADRLVLVSGNERKIGEILALFLLLPEAG